METLYRKVAVSERLPEIANIYITDIGDCTYSALLSSFVNGWGETDIDIEWWLEEIPDPSAQLQADKAELLEALEEAKQFLNYVQAPATPAIRLRMEIETLIQKMKL